MRKKPEPVFHGNLDSPNTVDETRRRVLAQASLDPSVSAACSLQDILKPQVPEVLLNDFIDELQEQIKLVSEGKMDRMEALLTAQAHTLNALFNRLVCHGIANLAEYPDAMDRYMRLAFKAQAQARATVETLHEMKHPKPVSFVQQANIAHGPQQVNNATVPRASAHAREIENKPNELLEQTHGERLDPSSAGTPAPADTRMETVGAVHGTQNKRRKGRLEP